jgi:DNA modification methylase
MLLQLWVYLVNIVRLEVPQEYIEISEKRLQAIFDRGEALSKKGTLQRIPS